MFTASNGVIVRLVDTVIGKRMALLDENPAQVNDYAPTRIESWLDPRQWEAAREYFASHPAPKPWQDAQVGDVWLLTFAGFETTGSSPWTVRPGRLAADAPEFVYPQNGNTLALDDPEIVDARRIWPEVSA